MALNVLIVGAVVAAVVLCCGFHGPREAPPPMPASAEDVSERRGWSRTPEAALAAVAFLIYLNQVLFTVHVLRVHGGDTSFIARYLPDGWFDLARGPMMQWFAGHFPLPGALAPAVLRVQAFLELPFVVFGYLAICRWFSPDVYRLALRLTWPAAITYTAVFCLIEWQFRNPYTVDDLVLRMVSAIAVPLWAARLSRRPANPSSGDTGRLSGLLLFMVSSVCLATLILVVYDTALLYNLGHLPANLLTVTVALMILISTRYAARRWDRGRVFSAAPGRPGGCVDSVTRTLGWSMALFYVPALPIRYGLGFGAAYTAAAGVLLLGIVALVLGLREAAAHRSGSLMTLLIQLAATFAIAAGGSAATWLLPAGHFETRLLRGAAAFLVCVLACCGFVDRMVGVIGSGLHRGHREDMTWTTSDARNHG